MNAASLSTMFDAELIARLAELLREERQLTAEVLLGVTASDARQAVAASRGPGAVEDRLRAALIDRLDRVRSGEPRLSIRERAEVSP